MAVGVVSGLALAGIPNVELVTATIFVAGNILGSSAGALTGALTELIFAGFHPMGSSMGILLLSQVVGMSLAGAIGGISAPVIIRLSGGVRMVAVAVLGFAVTLMYDLLTNLAYPLAAGFSFSQIAPYLIAGVPFAIIHCMSNMIVFAVLVTPLLHRLRRVLTSS